VLLIVVWKKYFDWIFGIGYLQAGGTAGITVDVALFPLDTLKTRLQSPCGFFESGGFRHLYKGVGTAAIGSAPTGK
jgi:solute carrier family 25 S-adenosylmethionine transporter 26